MASDPGTLVIVGGIIGVILTSITGIVVARTNAKATTTTPKLPPYDSLANRLTRLEEKDQEKDHIIEKLKERMSIIITDRDALVAYVKQWWEWAMSGAEPPPPPIPVHLRDLLDPDEWDVAKVTERTTTTTTTYVRPPGSDSAMEEHEQQEIERGTN